MDLVYDFAHRTLWVIVNQVEVLSQDFEALLSLECILWETNIQTRKKNSVGYE